MGYDKPTGLYGWIQSNDGRSLGLFLAFLVAMQVICAINLFLPLVILDPRHAPFLGWGGYLLRYAPIMLVGSILWFAKEMFWHIESVKKASGFRFIDDRDEPRLCRIIEPLIMTMGLPVPFVGVIESNARNAFACGVARKKAVVVVTRGLIDSLDDQELAAVLGHELSHIKHGDIRLMAAANIFMTRLQLLHAKNALRFTPLHVLLAMAIPAVLPLALVGTLMGHLVLRAGQISRLMIASAREYIADAEAVQLTQNPAALASALVKVEHNYRVETTRREDDAMMIAGETDGEDATHPTVAQRIAALARTTGSMVFNAPGAIRDEEWARSATLSEARAAALLRQLPQARVIERVREGTKTNLLGMTPAQSIMVFVTIACLGWLHAGEMNNPRAIAAKFDVRPLSVMLGGASDCMFAAYSDAAMKSCRAGSPDGGYRQFEGQKNTLVGWLADLSKRRKAEGYVHADATLGNTLHTEKITEYTGVSLRMKSVKTAMADGGMFATGGSTFSSAVPQDMTVAELDQIGCFPGSTMYQQPEGHFKIGAVSQGEHSFETFREWANNSATQPVIKGSDSADTLLHDYVEKRELYLLMVFSNFGFPGLRPLQADYLSGPHPAMIELLRERMKDPGFTASLSPLDLAKHRALARSPKDFVPCVALRYLKPDEALLPGA